MADVQAPVISDSMGEVPVPVENAQVSASSAPNFHPTASVVNPLASILADPMNPYFLHPGESPGLVLVSTPLIESNYHFWSQAMIMALESKNKIGFVNGSIQETAYWRLTEASLGTKQHTRKVMDNS